MLGCFRNFCAKKGWRSGDCGCRLLSNRCYRCTTNFVCERANMALRACVLWVVDVLISGRPDDNEVFDSPSSIVPELDSLEMALVDLLVSRALLRIIHRGHAWAAHTL